VAAWALLREARAQAGLSQRALAARSGVAQSEIARIENGRQEPSFDRLVHLVRSAGFDLRVELAARDEHDAFLIREMLACSPEERLDSLAGYAEFFAAAREITAGSKRS
jgi:transcriptional regulator with XRE-family HTH domain